MNRDQIIKELVEEFAKSTETSKKQLFLDALVRVRDMDLYTLMMTDQEEK